MSVASKLITELNAGHVVRSPPWVYVLPDNVVMRVAPLCAFRPMQSPTSFADSGAVWVGGANQLRADVNLSASHGIATATSCVLLSMQSTGSLWWSRLYHVWHAIAAG